MCILIKLWSEMQRAADVLTSSVKLSPAWYKHLPAPNTTSLSAQHQGLEHKIYIIEEKEAFSFLLCASLNTPNPSKYPTIEQSPSFSQILGCVMHLLESIYQFATWSLNTLLWESSLTLTLENENVNSCIFPQHVKFKYSTQKYIYILVQL